MISKNTVCLYCCEDISLIENYDKAIVSDETWECHHRKETDEGISQQELVEMGLYYNRPANELIFLTKADHNSIHKPFSNNSHDYPVWNKGLSKETDERVAAYGEKISKAKSGVKLSEKTKQNMSISRKGKPKSEAHKKATSDALSGKPKSESHKQHISESLIGTEPWNKGKKSVYSDDTKAKMSEKKKGRHWKLVNGKRVWYD